MTGASVLVIERAAGASDADIAALRDAGLAVLVVEDATRVRVLTVGVAASVALASLDAIASLGNNDAARRVGAFIADRLVNDARKEMREIVAPAVRGVES